MEDVVTIVSVITTGALLVTSCSAGVGRYMVTATPLDIGAVRQRLCIAVDPSTSDRVWWWEPGRSGCRTRSTGPTVFHAEGASVVRTSNTIDVRFRLQLIVANPQKQRSFADVLLTIDRYTFRCSSTGHEVQAARLRRLEVPEQVP